MTAFPQAINASASPEVQTNENFLALQALGTYSHNAVADSGLVRGYSGGRWGGFSVADVAHTFAASTTTYVSVKRADGSLDFSTSSTNYTTAATYAKVETVVTGTASITSVLDDRSGPGGAHGGGGSSSYTPGEGVNPQTGTSYTFVNTDLDKLVTFSNSAAIAAGLPQAGSGGNFAATWFTDVENRGAGTLTITPTTSTIDGLTSFALTTGQGMRLVSDGTNYFTERGVGGSSGGSTSVTTKGDLQGFSTVAARIPVGADGTVMTADSTQALGLKWAAASGGGGVVKTNVMVAASDEVTALTASTSVPKVTFRAPFAMTGITLNASLTTAQASGATLVTLDVKVNGTTMFSTQPTFDNTEKTTVTAATPAVQTVTAWAADDEITVFCSAITAASVAAGLKLDFIGSVVGANVIQGVPTVRFIGTGGGDVSNTSSSYVDLGGLTTLSIAASVGDKLELDLSALFAGSGSPAVSYLQVIVNGTARSSPNPYVDSSSGNTKAVLLRWPIDVASGDISAGLVSVKVQWKLAAGTSMAMSNSGSAGVAILPNLALKNYGDGSGIRPSNANANTTSGLYSARPVASTAGSGAVYYATDVQEGYVSNGATWTVIPCGGTELGYAEISTAFSTSSTSFVDVTGMSFSCTVGERPLIMEFEGHVQNSGGTGKCVIVSLVANAVGPQQGEKVFWMENGANYQTAYARARIPAGTLTPGTSYTFKVQLRADVASGGTAQIYSDSTWRSFVRLATG